MYEYFLAFVLSQFITWSSCLLETRYGAHYHLSIFLLVISGLAALLPGNWFIFSLLWIAYFRLLNSWACLTAPPLWKMASASIQILRLENQKLWGDILWQIETACRFKLSVTARLSLQSSVRIRRGESMMLCWDLMI